MMIISLRKNVGILGVIVFMLSVQPISFKVPGYLSRI